MLTRSIVSILLLICSLSTVASAADLYPMPDQQVATAALRYRLKEYNEARDAASRAPQGGMREFMLGMSSLKLEQFEEAASHLGKAADSFPLLADYALYNQGRALFQVSRFAEAALPLQRLMKEFPESPLNRAAQQLNADALYANRDFGNAYTAYQRFIEKYPLGADAVSAFYNSALCQENMGDSAGAIVSLRNVRLRYPSSKLAVQADKDLQRLEAKGNKVVPYTVEEKLQYATTLYDLKRYDEAALVLQEIPWDSQPAGTADRYLLKSSQALFKAKKYKEAQAQFSALVQKKPARDIYEQALFWLAKSLDKTGREEDALASFIGLADSSTNPELADRALFEASLIKKWQKKTAEQLPLLKRILLTHPLSSLRQNASWEFAWGSYQSGDMKAAAEYFKALTDSDSREKALYWYGRTLSATGDIAGAQGAFSLLLAEFPFGYYSQTYEKQIRVKSDEGSFQVSDFCEILPVPSGYERIKALITLGFFDEARRELTFVKKKLPGKNAVPGIARLYLEMEDYNGAYNLLNNERLLRIDKNNFYQWGICFPLAYRKLVTQSAAEHNIPESLGYAIIRSESSFSPTALSPVGAVGLMQLMPATAARISTAGKGKFDAQILTNPEINIGFGMKHLQGLLTLYKNDVVLAVAAYNAGSGNVNRWRKSFGGMRTDEFIENIPFAETREYVKKVIATAGVYKRLYKLADPTSLPTLPKDSNESTALRSHLPVEDSATIAGSPAAN